MEEFGKFSYGVRSNELVMVCINDKELTSCGKNYVN